MGTLRPPQRVTDEPFFAPRRGGPDSLLRIAEALRAASGFGNPPPADQRPDQAGSAIQAHRAPPPPAPTLDSPVFSGQIEESTTATVSGEPTCELPLGFVVVSWSHSVRPGSASGTAGNCNVVVSVPLAGIVPTIQ
jgi:hypothetical protein